MTRTKINAKMHFSARARAHANWTRLTREINCILKKQLHALSKSPSTFYLPSRIAKFAL